MDITPCFNADAMTHQEIDAALASMGKDVHGSKAQKIALLKEPDTSTFFF